MNKFLFVSDLHGKVKRYQRLFQLIQSDRPDVLLLGGDLLPHIYYTLNKSKTSEQDFVHQFLIPEFARLKQQLRTQYPRIFLILGNDDSRNFESPILQAENDGLWDYLHLRSMNIEKYQIFGYSCVPPTPFTLKDWEKYDVSRFVDPGCISPEEGYRTVPVREEEAKYGTIQSDLAQLSEGKDLKNSIFLFHSPPYQTALDRAALDGKMIDHVPLDVHVGSIAIKRFIENQQPLITLHGHIHESSRITGKWKERIGRTHLFSAAYDGPELAVVKFDPEKPQQAQREILV
jgi:Icc-related predicted phosphoesterase